MKALYIRPIAGFHFCLFGLRYLVGSKVWFGSLALRQRVQDILEKKDFICTNDETRLSSLKLYFVLINCETYF